MYTDTIDSRISIRLVAANGGISTVARSRGGAGRSSPRGTTGTNNPAYLVGLDLSRPVEHLHLRRLPLTFSKWLP